MAEKICIKLISFGHTFGVPKDVDFLYSIRHLPVSHIENYRQYNGKHLRLQNELFSLSEYNEMLNKIHDQLTSFIPHSTGESITVDVGCEEGQHRSVAMIERLGELLGLSHPVEIDHRDLQRMRHGKKKKRERTKNRDHKYSLLENFD